MSKDLPFSGRGRSQVPIYFSNGINILHKQMKSARKLSNSRNGKISLTKPGKKLKLQSADKVPQKLCTGQLSQPVRNQTLLLLCHSSQEVWLSNVDHGWNGRDGFAIASLAPSLGIRWDWSQRNSSAREFSMDGGQAH